MLWLELLILIVICVDASFWKSAFLFAAWTERDDSLSFDESDADPDTTRKVDPISF